MKVDCKDFTISWVGVQESTYCIYNMFICTFTYITYLCYQLVEPFDGLYIEDKGIVMREYATSLEIFV